MYRVTTYSLLFLITVLLQIFLFDNLSVSIYLNPLIYVAFVVLLPVDALPVLVLLAGLLMGAAMDFLMGTAGINTMATLLLAFVRQPVLTSLYNRDDLREGGIPSPERLGHHVFLNYLIVLVLVHHTVFFTLEALSWSHALRTAVRVVASSAVTVAVVWLLSRMFTAKFVVRL
ncbi:MAG: rod shape-determining protein MreD [Alistipes sp.]|nr:rod shape-determining protein MreD [Alistipes sp.]MDE5906791.1 rod shape-determining protein MreD [Alistipes sp.]MDE6374793.1 rod shape-determining protein MreD [Alistipes sp.]